MKQKNLTEYIEKRNDRLVQAYIDNSLYMNLLEKAKKNHVKVKQIVEAAFKKYLDENK